MRGKYYREIPGWWLVMLVLLLSFWVAGEQGKDGDTATRGKVVLEDREEDGKRGGKLRQAVEAGRPIDVAIGEHWSERFLFRPSKLVADGFELSVGVNEGGAIEAEIASFEGLSSAESKANLVMVGDTIAVTIREPGGAVIKIRTNPENGLLEARREDPDDQPFSCVLGDSSIASTRSLVPLSTMEELWSNAMPADLMAVTGVDPATGETDKYINPIRRAPLYDQSLADLRLLLVLDKSATGSADEANLVSKAALYMATVANVAACYENQLGIRLLLHELIMIPDSDGYEDVPTTTTGNGSVRSFENWLETYRAQETHLWSSAMKFGAGLKDRYLGLASLQSIESSTAFGICDPSARWNLLAHEIGHNLGSDHSEGGVMNFVSLGGDVRTFFANVGPERTAAMDVHTYSSSKLKGQSVMRHPEEMPFANDDRIVTARNESVQFNSLKNDSRFVLNGEENLLELAEVGAVTPAGAGTAVKVGNEILFSPAEDFVGTAWFSYSVRGTVGNHGAGWLHKGDVAVVVDEGADAFEITMAPGDTYSLEVRSGIMLTQPNQARVVKARDFNRLLLITANADAAGMDTFEAGGDTYTIHYDASSKVTLPDFIVHDPNQKSVTFNPLLNDPGAGQPWIHSVRPTLGATEAGEENGQDQVHFPTAFQLVSVENLTPELGALTQPEINVSLNGVPASVLDEIVTFTPVVGAAGLATLLYTVEDAAGNRASETAEILLPFQVDTLVEAGSSTRMKVPAGDDGAVTEWMYLEFDDSGWRMGNASMGYTMSEGNESEDFATDVSEMAGMTSSVWARIPFEVDEASDYSALSLRMRIDDGFVAYLNGEEIARMHAAGASPPTWNASATTDNPSTQGAARMVFDVTKHLGLLRSGDNVLAIHGLNASPISSDFLLIPELDAAVHGQTVGITSPQHSRVGVPEGVTLLLQGNAGGRPVQWMVLSSPEGGVATIQKPSAEDTAIDFSAPGEYQIGLLSPGAFQTRKLTVQVGEGAEGIPSGVAISTERSVFASSVQVDIEAFIDPLFGGDSLQWELVEGPGEVTFLDENAAIAKTLFSLAGDYVLRVLVTRDGVTTVDEVKVTVPPDAVSAALLGEVTVLGADRVCIDGRIEGILEKDVSLTLVLGLVDGGGREEARWEESRSFGGFGLGDFSLEVENLRSDSVYFCRLVAVDGDKKTWSYPQSFRSSVIDPGEEVVSLLEENRLSLPLYNYPSPGWNKAGWNQLEFTASDWFKSDGFPIGYGEAYDDLESSSPSALSTMRGHHSAVFMRLPFLVTGAERYSRLALKMQFDDGFVAYLNGVEIARANMAASEELQDDALAINDIPTSQGMAEGTFEVENFASLLREGENILALQGVNASMDSADFRMMTDLLACVPEVKSRIVSPTDDEIGIPQHVGLIVRGSVPEGNTLEGEGWSVVYVPEGGDAVIAESEMLETSVRFTTEGRYVLRFAAADENGDVGADFVTVHVSCVDLYVDAHQWIPTSDGQYRIYFGSNARVTIGEKEIAAGKVCLSLGRGRGLGYIDTEGLRVDIRAAIPTEGSFQTRLHVYNAERSLVEKFSGPGSIKYEYLGLGKAVVQFSEIGSYELRVIATWSGITTFDDATVTISRPLPGNGEDLDGDQIPDFEEWVLGSNPIDAGIGLDYLPRLTRSGAESIFSYPVRSDAADHGLSYILEVSSDLKEWIVPEPGDVSFRGGRVENRFPEKSSKTLFYRLRFKMIE